MLKRFKTRKFWDRDPVERPHSTKSGLKGYSRNNLKKQIEEELEEEEFINSEKDYDIYSDKDQI